jgi:glycosyltransferase involved in cell wall biosynthesis
MFSKIHFRLITIYWIVFSRIWMALPLNIRKLLKHLKYRYDARGILHQQTLLAEIIIHHPVNIPVIVFAPCLDWNVQIFQRPQQLALAFARQGTLVFYIQPQPNFKLPSFQKIIERMYLCNVIISAFDIIPFPIIYVLTWNSGYLSRFKSPRILYDYVDDIDVFYGDREQILQGHEMLTRKAEVLVVTAEKLYQDIRTMRPDALFCPNGVDYPVFEIAKQRDGFSPPADLAPVFAQGRPVIGYYGALARWFDYDLMVQVATLRPDYAFVLIGPDYDGTVRNQLLINMPNVYWLGAKTYLDLPNYLRYFDVATIPFILSDITHATSPIKLFEYMAGGKPVVVTPMLESLRYPGVMAGGDGEEFALKLDDALALRSDPVYLKTIDEVARANTWDSRAIEIMEALRDKEA